MEDGVIQKILQTVASKIADMSTEQRIDVLIDEEKLEDIIKEILDNNLSV